METIKGFTPGEWRRINNVVDIGATPSRAEQSLHLNNPADARLIALAPTLYADNAALRSRVAELEAALEGLMWRFEDDDSDPNSPSEKAPDILAARAALARATNKETA